MNIKHLLSAAAAVALFSACSEYDPGLSDSVQPYTEKEMDRLEEYTKNFTERYGTIAENHDFGFGDQGSVSETRSTRGATTNSNQWVNVIKDQATGEISFDTNGRIVPGFPVVNELSANQGKYHVKIGQNGESGFFTFDELKSKIQETGATVVYPLGDVDAWNNLSTDEVSEVKAIFDENMGSNFVSTSLLDLSTFWVQQIWHGQESYIDGFGQTVDLNVEKHMDWLCAYPYSYYDWGTGQTVTVNEPDHVNNFNAANGYIMLMENSGTQKFGFDSSSNSGHVYLDNFRMIQYKGNYYVGFDFEADGSNGNEEIHRDYVFNDWIVKITPGDGTPTPDINWHRVMCEDLGNTYDFDFNDLVFDVYFTGTKGNYVANIRVQAAGGTLPIYIGFDGNEGYEAHKLLGQSVTSVPVNVGQGVTAAYKDIQISMTAFGKGNSTNADDIPIYVGKTNAEGTKTTTLLPSIGSNVTAAPQKICIPDNTTKWTIEHGQFGSGISSYTGEYKEGAYSYFNAWIQYPNETYGFDGATPWNKNGIDTSKLYNK